jgi:hypothetical protein
MFSLKALLPVITLVSLSSAVDIKISGKAAIVVGGTNHTEFTAVRDGNEVCKGVVESADALIECPSGGKMSWHLLNIFDFFTVHYEDGAGLV